MNKETKAIVLAGDYGYIRYIEATIKSICYHNANVKIYLFNQDILKNGLFISEDECEKLEVS